MAIIGSSSQQRTPRPNGTTRKEKPVLTLSGAEQVLWTVIGLGLGAFLAISPVAEKLSPLIAFCFGIPIAWAMGVGTQLLFRFPGALYFVLMGQFSLTLAEMVLGKFGLGALKLTILSLLANVAIIAFRLITRTDWIGEWRVRFPFIFAVISIVYYFVHASVFKASDFTFGYTAGAFTANSDFAGAPGKFVVMMGAVSLLVAAAGAYFSVKEFRDKLTGEDGILSTIALWFCRLQYLNLFMLLLYFEKRQAFYFPILIVISGVLLEWIRRNALEKKVILNVPLVGAFQAVMAVMIVVLPFLQNKTSLVASFACLGLFGITSWLKGFNFGIPALWHQLKKSRALYVVIPGFVAALLAALAFTDLKDVITARLDYFIEGFKNKRSASIRIENLQYLYQDWRMTVDWWNVLFGYGLAKSRETIFFISAMRGGQVGTLVQTVHNSYVEYLYDYGLMSLFYFGSYLLILFQAIKTWLAKAQQGDPDPRQHFACGIFGVLAFIGIYGSMDGIRVPFLLQCFVFLSVLVNLIFFLPGPDLQSKFNPLSANASLKRSRHRLPSRAN